MDEISKKFKLNLEKLKKWTGGDRESGRVFYSADHKQFFLYCTFIVSGNKLPSFDPDGEDEDSKALFNRFVVFRWPVSFAKRTDDNYDKNNQKPDPSIADKFRAGAPYFMSYVLQKWYPKLLEAGNFDQEGGGFHNIPVPDNVARDTNSFIHSQSSVDRWFHEISETTKLLREKKDNERVNNYQLATRRRLHQHYENWFQTSIFKEKSNRNVVYKFLEAKLGKEDTIPGTTLEAYSNLVFGY
jgi:hypothetical protein